MKTIHFVTYMHHFFLIEVSYDFLRQPFETFNFKGGMFFPKKYIFWSPIWWKTIMYCGQVDDKEKHSEYRLSPYLMVLNFEETKFDDW